MPQLGKGSRYNHSVPVTVAIDPEGRFVVMTLTDPYSIEEWRAGMLELFALPSFQTQRLLLIDRRQCEPPTTAFVTAMVQFFADHQSDLAQGRGAIVVRDDTGFGMGRMMQLRTQVNNPDTLICVFRDYADAIKWLVPT